MPAPQISGKVLRTLFQIRSCFSALWYNFWPSEALWYVSHRYATAVRHPYPAPLLTDVPSGSSLHEGRLKYLPNAGFHPSLPYYIPFLHTIFATGRTLRPGLLQDIPPPWSVWLFPYGFPVHSRTLITLLKTPLLLRNRNTLWDKLSRYLSLQKQLHALYMYLSVPAGTVQTMFLLYNTQKPLHMTIHSNSVSLYHMKKGLLICLFYPFE